MAGTVESQEVAARDDAQLRALGIKPELRRTLGFLSNFAIAFSFISVSTGSFGNFGVGLGLGGPAAIFWSWVLVVTGQFIVCLGFAELASHFPVAGSIYQWSKRLSNRTLGWFTGWFYFWAQVVTVSAVAVIVGYVIAGFTGGGQEFLDSPSPAGYRQHAHVHRGDHVSDHDPHQRVRRQAAVDPQQHRRCHRDPGHGGLRADLAVLCQSPARLGHLRHGRDRGGDRRELSTGIRAGPVHVDLHPVRVRHGRNLRRGDDRRLSPGPARRDQLGPDLGSGRPDLPAPPFSWRCRTRRSRSRRAWLAGSRSQRSSPRA